MKAPSPGPAAEAGELADAFSALGHPVRLAILAQLGEPKALEEIRVPRAGTGAPGPASGSARRTIEAHLERLVELGVVGAEETRRSRGPTVEYSVDERVLYALGETVKGLADRRPAAEPDERRRGKPARSPRDGPRLVLVKGLHEGRRFSLDDDATERWVVGRHEGAEVSLGFDPYVSRRNAVIRRRGERFWIEDHPGSRNGTRLDFRVLPDGQPHPLEDGAVIGVGKSVLVFRARQALADPPPAPAAVDDRR